MVDQQIKIALLAIAIAIPSSSYFVWQIDKDPNHASFAERNKLQALTSFYPLYEFTKEIAQDQIQVSLLVPFGIEPHDWEPTINDLQRIQESDVIIINGLGFENWINEIERVNPEVLLVDTSKGIPIIYNDNTGNKNFEKHENENRSDPVNVDPHIWLNPPMAKIQIQNIVEALSKIDPSNKKFFVENADSYISKIDLLDTKIRNELSSCKKDFISSHNSFSYFSKQYGLTQHTILDSNDPHEEPTFRTLEKSIRLAKNLQIKIIFTEEGVNNRASQLIANEIGGRVLLLSPIEVPDKNSSYLTKMEQNLSNLKVALCK